MGITALVALLICDWPAYAPKHPRRGVEPQEQFREGAGAGIFFADNRISGYLLF